MFGGNGGGQRGVGRGVESGAGREGRGHRQQFAVWCGHLVKKGDREWADGWRTVSWLLCDLIFMRWPESSKIENPPSCQCHRHVHL